MKIMSDGFSAYPAGRLKNVKSVEDMEGLKPKGENRPWITKQVEFVKEITTAFGKDLLLFYNIFAPANYFRLLQDTDPYAKVAGLIKEDAEKFNQVLGTIGQDIAVLAKKVIVEGGADGIYLSVQSIQDAYVTKDVYENIISPSELAVLNAANSANENNLLHICGYEGGRNDIT